MDRAVARVGAWAGVLSLLGILGSHIGLQVIAGQRVSGTTDAAAITAYYAHPGIASWSLAEFLVLIPMAIFAVALRETLSTATWTRFLTTVALVAVVAELPVILAEVAAQAALVAAALSGGEVVPLFRFWDALYNSGAYALEGTWVAAFGLAMRGVPAFPRWLPRFSLFTSALLLINETAIWVGIPDIATLPSALFLAVWFGGASYGLYRVATARAELPAQPKAGNAAAVSA
jgi:hypothetical protein